VTRDIYNSASQSMGRIEPYISYGLLRKRGVGCTSAGRRRNEYVDAWCQDKVEMRQRIFPARRCFSADTDSRCPASHEGTMLGHDPDTTTKIDMSFIVDMAIAQRCAWLCHASLRLAVLSDPLHEAMLLFTTRDDAHSPENSVRWTTSPGPRTQS
jgi:hypothetical protein